MLLAAMAARYPIAWQDHGCHLYSVALDQILHNLKPNRSKNFFPIPLSLCMPMLSSLPTTRLLRHTDYSHIVFR